MGNLQSVLGDCTLREVPDFISHYVPKSATFFDRRPAGSRASGGGDETYIVYAEKSTFPNATISPADAFGASDDKTSLMQDYRQHSDRQEKILADLVDLCVDGADSEIRPQSSGKTISGARVYNLPKASNAKEMRTEVWTENETENEAETKAEIGKTLDGSALEEENSVDDIARSDRQEAKIARVECGATGEDREKSVENDEKGGGVLEENLDGEGDVEPERPIVDQTLVRLNMCREEEKELRKSFVILAFPFEMDEESKQVKKWYIVEASWFRQWSKFLQGASRPGPITNELLFDRDGQPKEELRPGEHYFGMDQEAWSQLSDRYGCDVAVCKSSYDIYT